MRKVMPPPHPDVRMRSVGSVTGCERVTSARPSTSEMSRPVISAGSSTTFSIQR